MTLMIKYRFNRFTGNYDILTNSIVQYILYTCTVVFTQANIHLTTYRKYIT